MMNRPSISLTTMSCRNESVRPSSGWSTSKSFRSYSAMSRGRCGLGISMMSTSGNSSLSVITMKARSPACQPKTLWIVLASLIRALRSPKCSESLFGFSGSVTSQMETPPLKFGPHASLFMRSTSPVNHLVLSSMTCIPSPGRVSWCDGMKPTNSAESGSVSMSLMSTTYAPASGLVWPPVSGPAQSGSPQLARNAVFPSGDTATSAIKSGVSVTSTTSSRSIFPHSPVPIRCPSSVPCWPSGSAAAGATVIAANAKALTHTTTGLRRCIAFPLCRAHIADGSARPVSGPSTMLRHDVADCSISPMRSAGRSWLLLAQREPHDERAQAGREDRLRNGKLADGVAQLLERHHPKACPFGLIQCPHGRGRKQVVGDHVPPGPHHPDCLGECLLPLDGVMEHDPGQHDVEGVVVEGEGGRIGLADSRALGVRNEPSFRGGHHVGVDVGDGDRDAGVGGEELSGRGSASGTDLECATAGVNALQRPWEEDPASQHPPRGAAAEDGLARRHGGHRVNLRVLVRTRSS